MTGRPFWMIEFWGKLNSTKSAENRTVKTALGAHVVIKSNYIMSPWNGHIDIWNANSPAFKYETFKW